MILLLLLASLLASPSASTRPGFDYFVLALQWPGTVCRSSAAGPCCSSNACCRSVHFLCLRKPVPRASNSSRALIEMHVCCICNSAALILSDGSQFVSVFSSFVYH